MRYFLLAIMALFLGGCIPGLTPEGTMKRVIRAGCDGGIVVTLPPTPGLTCSKPSVSTVSNDDTTTEIEWEVTVSYKIDIPRNLIVECSFWGSKDVLIVTDQAPAIIIGPNRSEVTVKHKIKLNTEKVVLVRYITSQATMN